MVSSSSISNHTSSGYGDYLEPTNEGAPAVDAPDSDSSADNQSSNHELDSGFGQLSLNDSNFSNVGGYRPGDQPQVGSIGPLPTYPGQLSSDRNTASLHATGDELVESEHQSTLSPSVIYQQAFPQLAAAQLAQQQQLQSHHHQHHQHPQSSGRQLYPTAYPTSCTVCVQNVSINLL